MTHDDREAITSLAARLRERDATEPAQREDPEAFARTFLAALRGHGYRQTQARPAVDWRVTETPADPDAQHRHAAEARAAIRAAREGSPT